MRGNKLLRRFYNVLLKWRYYSIGRADYKKSMEKEFSNNLYSLWFLSLWFAIFSLVYFLIYSIFFATILPIFFVLSACSFTFSAYSHIKYKQHLGGKQIRKSLVYTMIVVIYTAIISTGLYISMYLLDSMVALIFMVLLATAPIFLFVSPIFSLMLTSLATTVFVFLNLPIGYSAVRYDNILMLLPVVPIAIFFSWFSNRYRILLAFTTVKIEEERDKYQVQSTIDELTQLGNRRDFELRFQRYLDNYRINENFLCLAIMDIDYFKKYNDYYGHPKGDECLRSIGMALADTWENSSVYAARIGGEEFALLWFEEDMRNAMNVIAELEERIKALKIPHEKSDASSNITFSIGLYIKERESNVTMQEMYESADSALYEAKSRGRNNAVVFNKDKKTPLEPKSKEVS